MKRRGRGEGSIFFRQDRNLWCGVLTAGYDANGKRRRRVVYGATKAKVLEKMARTKHAALTGMLGEPSKLTVAQFLTRWLEDAARPAIREATYRQYEGLIRVHITPRLGGVALTKLTPAHVQGLLGEMQRASNGAKVRLLVYQVLSTALKQAVRWNMIPRNVCEAVIRPRVPRNEMQALTSEQTQRLLDAALDGRLHALYALLVSTGARLGEALGLTWPCVDLKRGTVEIRQQLAEVRGKLWLQEPKTKSARRTVDLPAFVAKALRDHEERTKAEGTLLNDQLLVFTDSEGGAIRKSNLRRRSFEPLLKEAGIPHVRLHDLRHTAATLALKAGVPLHVVSRMLGHSRVSITADIYAHVLPGQGKDAARIMDAVFTAATRKA